MHAKRPHARLILPAAGLLLSAALVMLSMALWYLLRLSFLADHNYLPEIEQLISEGRTGEALALGKAVIEMGDAPSSPEIDELIKRTEEQAAGWINRGERFMKGALLNDVTSMEGVVGAGSADLLVIGDVRDLGIEGYKYYNDEEVDELIVLLSTAGVASSVAAFLPAPEPGHKVVAVSAEAGISILKSLRKGRMLTKRLSGIVLIALKQKDWRQFASVTMELTDLLKHAPKGTLAVVMKNVDELQDLKLVNQLCSKAPHQTVALMHVSRNYGLECVQMTRHIPLERMTGLVRKGEKFFHTLVRVKVFGTMATRLFLMLMENLWQSLFLRLLLGLLALAVSIFAIWCSRASSLALMQATSQATSQASPTRSSPRRRIPSS